MTNTVIVFTATRALVAGVISEEEISLALTLSAFDATPQVKKKVFEAKSGARESSLFSITDHYRCSIGEDGVVTLGDTSTVPLATEYLEMFFRSVVNDESFTMTNIDTGATMDCVLVGTWSRERPAASWIDEFRYTFTVREEVT